MIEVIERSTGNRIAIAIDEIVAVRSMESKKRCKIYLKTNWYFDCMADYETVKNIVLKRRKAKDERGDAYKDNIQSV